MMNIWQRLRKEMTLQEVIGALSVLAKDRTEVINGAVAPKVEPRENESGVGFDSPPAPPKEWAGLTDEDIEEGHKESWVHRRAFESVAWWAERKLKEKNNG
jgi:hypothetical protein